VIARIYNFVTENLAKPAMRPELVETKILPAKAPHSRADRRLHYFCYATLLMVVVIFAFVRIRLRTAPLERDEGEYAYAGQLMLQGVPPYQLAYNMKLPGTYAAYAVMMAVFGQTAIGIREGMLVVLLANTLMVFLLTRRLFGLLAGTVAAATYTLLANRLWTMSLDGHATHFIVLAALAATLLLLRAIDTQSKTVLFLSGLGFGLAFLMKQHGAMFAVFGALFWAWSEWKQSASWRRVLSGGSIFSAGVILPYLFTLLVVWYDGVFQQFWYWTVQYGSTYQKLLHWMDLWLRFLIAWPWVKRPILTLLTAGFGLTALIWSRRGREHAVFVLGFTLFSIIAVCLGFYLRPHYFLVLLPAVALLAGLGISAVYEYLQERNVSPAVAWIPIVFFLISYFSGLLGQRKVLFEMDPLNVHRQMHLAHGFAEAVAVADYVKNHTTDQDRIAVLGSEPEIYFLSGRHSATGYIYTYPLVEKQKYALRMQEEMIREIEQSHPKLVIFTDNQLSWGWEPGWNSSDPRMYIFNWMRDFLNAHYELVAEVPIEKALGREWGDPCRFYIFRRSGPD
jgi:4-amino-4-deoxy-L-arabinose transferase-like glycosyltransferase